MKRGKERERQKEGTLKLALKANFQAPTNDPKMVSKLCMVNKHCAAVFIRKMMMMMMSAFVVCVILSH